VPYGPAPYGPTPYGPAAYGPAPLQGGGWPGQYPATPPYPPYRGARASPRGIPIIGVVGGALLALSSVVPWLRHTVTSRANAFNVPAAFLFNDRAGDRGLRLGFVVLALGVAAIVLLLTGLPVGRALGRAVGVVGLVVAGLFLVQFARLWSDLHQTGAISNLGIGMYVAALGGALALIGGPLAGKRP
jgi:hypothetical protein